MADGFSVYTAVKYGKIGLVREWLDTKPEPAELGRRLLIAASTDSASPDVVELLIAAGADPNFTEELNGYRSGPPLSAAVGSSSLQIVQKLVELGASVAYSAPYQFNAMNAAVYGATSALRDIVTSLISLGIDLDVESDYGESPLSISSRRGLFDVVGLLLDAGADPSPLGWTPLMYAVVFGSVAECQAILQINPQLEERDRKWERTAFLLAVQSGDVEKVELLLGAGAYRDDRGRCGKSALIHAAEMNHVAMLEWLAAKGADVNATDNFGRTALMVAADCGSTGCVSLLLNSGADAHSVTQTLDSAIDRSANIEITLMLRDAGADVNRIAGDGFNLLKRAVERENLDFVRQLLKIGADPNRTSTGEVPLHLAIRPDDMEIARVLLDNDADPNAHDVDGWVPLFEVKSIEAARLLLDANADPGLIASGKTALDYVPSEVRAFLEGQRTLAQRDRQTSHSEGS